LTLARRALCAYCSTATALEGEKRAGASQKRRCPPRRPLDLYHSVRTDFSLWRFSKIFVYFKHEDEARGPAFVKQFLPLVNS
jgi:hypothetical protein